MADAFCGLPGQLGEGVPPAKGTHASLSKASWDASDEVLLTECAPHDGRSVISKATQTFPLAFCSACTVHRLSREGRGVMNRGEAKHRSAFQLKMWGSSNSSIDAHKQTSNLSRAWGASAFLLSPIMRYYVSVPLTVTLCPLSRQHL